MNVAICRISLRVHGSHSLKRKRQIGRSVISRVGTRFRVSISEVDDNNLWQRLTLGISCVSNDGRHANEIISRVVEYIGNMSGETELLDYELETISVL